MLDFSHFRRPAALILSLSVTMGALASCAPASPSSSSSSQEQPDSSFSQSNAPSPNAPDPFSSTGSPSTQPDPTVLQPVHDTINDSKDAQPDSPPPQAPPQEPADSSYDFSQPVPKSDAVDISYFDDAAFVGDSRTDGFLIYSGIGRGKNLTSNGLSIFKLGTKKALTIDGTQYTLLEALALEQYGKVYLSLGINELGYNNDEGFYQSYCDAIDSIRAVQPNAVIYIQGLIPVNEDLIAQTSGRTYLTNEHLRVYNDLMQKTAEEKQVVYLDLYSEFVNEDGQLPAEASKDGVHLRSAWCKQWLAYLETHTVDYDTLYPNGAPQPAPAERETTEGSVVQ